MFSIKTTLILSIYVVVDINVKGYFFDIKIFDYKF